MAFGSSIEGARSALQFLWPTAKEGMGLDPTLFSETLPKLNTLPCSSMVCEVATRWRSRFEKDWGAFVSLISNIDEKEREREREREKS
jgi:hypothetical protein